ncbi:MAG: DUF2442 domain-containing protein [Pseudomonadota bacterium]|nr:DUF2442 domain-containing protein [Pseudomonadota bacterium]
MMKKYHEIKNVRFEQDYLALIVDGKEIKADVATLSPTLAAATEKEKNTFEVSPSGYGIHWPLIDEDLSVDGMLGTVHRPGWEKQSA